MSTPAERVRHLVEAGTLAPEEGERLLAAMEQPPRSRLSAMLNPFERFGGGAAALAGLVIAALSTLVALLLGVRFDGFLDLHIPPSAPPLRVAVVDQLSAWLVPALCFWAYARVLQRHVRMIDFVGMVGLARLPLLLAAVPVRSMTRSLLADPTKPGPLALAGICVALLFVAANITLLYGGFKNASGLTGRKLVVGFIVLLIGAEIVSKLALGLAS